MIVVLHAAYMSSPCHIELILSEKEEPVKKEVIYNISLLLILYISKRKNEKECWISPPVFCIVCCVIDLLSICLTMSANNLMFSSLYCHVYG